MENVLFHFAGLPVYAYGFMLACGLFFGSSLAIREAKRRGIGMERMFDYIIGLSLVYLGVGRIAAAFHFHGLSVIWRPWLIFTSFRMGINLNAAAVAAVVFTIYFTVQHRLLLGVFLDAVTPSLALARSLAFLGSDVFGTMTEMPWAVRIGGYSLHPVQLYMAIGYYLVFTVLWRMRKSGRFDGQIFLGYLVLTGLLRWLVSFFEADGAESTTNPWLFLSGAILGGLLWLHLYRGAPILYQRRRHSNLGAVVTSLVLSAVTIFGMIVFFYWRFSGDMVI